MVVPGTEELPTPRRSPLAMAVLALLAEDAMHVYRMQQLIRERAKDAVVNVASRNSVHQVVDRLVRDGLAAVISEDGRRATYGLTPLGARTLAAWFAEMLERRREEYPEFPAALAFVALLTPGEVTTHLRRRADSLREQLTLPSPAEVAQTHSLRRVFLIEEEFRRAMLQAEYDWVTATIADLDNGSLSWTAFGVRPTATESRG